MSIRALVILALSLAVAGCATSPTNTLTQDARDSLRIDAVDVSFADDARIEWYDAQINAPEEPAARLAFLKQKAIGPIKTALDAEIPPAFRGNYPVRFKVQVRRVRIPARAFNIIVGTSAYIIIADMELVDSKTGKTLMTASKFNGFSTAYGGVAGILEAAAADDPIIRVSKAFAHGLSVWLKTGSKLETG